jgi:hypothetical protein
MARTTAERLTFWEDLRDVIEDAIAASITAGGSIVEYEIGNRRVKKTEKEARDDLKLAEEMIASLTEAGSVGTGPVRNLIQLTRYPR